MVNWAWLYVASEWLIRLLMLVYVPQRRSPAAARTWLLLIFIHPWVGLGLYAIFGRVYVPQRRIDLQTRVSETLRSVGKGLFGRRLAPPELPARFQQATLLAEHLGDFSTLAGNRLELLTDYDGIIDRLIADIEAAQHHVHLLVYIFDDDRTGRRVCDAIIAAAQRGVACRVFLDSHGAKPAVRRLAPKMRAAGIEVLEMMPVRFFGRATARVDLRNHRKIAVIDGRVAYVGSQNIVDASFRGGLVYEELVARVTGPVVMQFQTVFLTDRYLETGEDIDTEPSFPQTEITGTSPAQVIPSGPGYQHANNQRLIVSLLHAAERRIVLTTPYFVPDDALLQALQSAALRGVDVHLIVSAKCDQKLVGLAQRSYYEELLEAGIKIHLYQPGLLHAKHLSVDDTVAVIGSSNLDLRSFVLNAEINLIVYDPAVAAELRTIQERNIAAAELLTLEQWQQRPFLSEVMQNTARLVDTLL